MPSTTPLNVLVLVPCRLLFFSLSRSFTTPTHNQIHIHANRTIQLDEFFKWNRLTLTNKSVWNSTVCCSKVLSHLRNAKQASSLSMWKKILLCIQTVFVCALERGECFGANKVAWNLIDSENLDRKQKCWTIFTHMLAIDCRCSIYFHTSFSMCVIFKQFPRYFNILTDFYFFRKIFNLGIFQILLASILFVVNASEHSFWF